MKRHLLRHSHIAARDVGGMGMASLDSGYALGLVVVDSNRPAKGATARPAANAGIAGALRKQAVATH